MSKVNAMQAMREARYAARKPVTAPAVPARPVRVDVAAPVDKSRATVAPDVVIKDVVVMDGLVGDAAADGAGPGETEATEEALCGHRSMNNRICKRPAGHSEKNHRYN
ncbi:hypothetical protein ABIB25_000357 [Nakamurella sp. UYEF19]|uniref:hypothetical protein n=1 Tax=Nakamurella sp. UYEF19 TaxID=1756392 RepID=UPI0033995765